MENPFKTIIADEKLPETMKQKVMDDVALIKFSLEVADLVSVKYPEAIGNFFGLNKSSTQPKIEEEIEKENQEKKEHNEE